MVVKMRRQGAPCWGVESEPTGREGQREGDRDRAANGEEGEAAAERGQVGRRNVCGSDVERMKIRTRRRFAADHHSFICSAR